MQTIKVSTRSAYGQTYVDVIDDKTRGALQSLTGNSTLTQNNINSLKVLGFNFELVCCCLSKTAKPLSVYRQ